MQVRKLLYWALAGLLIFYLVNHRTELLNVVRVVLHGTWYWMAFAVFFQVFHYIFHANSLRESFASMGMPRRRREYLPITLAALAVNVVAPSLNVSGAAFVVDEMRKKGYKAVGSVIATAIAVLSDGVAFVVGALLVACFLFIKQELSAPVLLGVLFLTSTVLTLVALILFFWKRPNSLNWLFSIIGKKRAHTWKEEWHKITEVALPFKKITPVVMYEGLSHLTNFMSLCCAFLAFGIDPVSLVPATAYVVAVIFIIFSPTPMGIGFAEGGMALAMVGQGVPEAEATAITIAFRGVSFWLPFLIGTFFLHKIQQDARHES